MHRAPRAAAPRALTLLTAVLLTLLGLLTGFATSTTSTISLSAASSAGGPWPYSRPPVHAAPVLAGRPEAPPAGRQAAASHTPPRAGDQCPDACAVQAGARHELRGERPAPPVHLAVTPDATAAPAPAPAWTPPPRAPVPASPGHPVPDRGRAPPAPSGT